MPITVSGMFTSTFAAVYANTLALSLVDAGNRCALFTNSITPDYDASLANAAYGAGQYASNEVSGVGYATGGALVPNPTLTNASGLVTLDASDIDWATATITNAHGALIYADALAGNNGIVFVNFGGDYSSVNGLFRIQWSGSGILYNDLVP